MLNYNEKSTRLFGVAFILSCIETLAGHQDWDFSGGMFFDHPHTHSHKTHTLLHIYTTHSFYFYYFYDDRGFMSKNFVPKQGRIHDTTVADGWAEAVMQFKNATDGGTDGRTDRQTDTARGRL